MNSVIKKICGEIFPDGFYFVHQGQCPCCGKSTAFFAKTSWLRDSFICTQCGSLPRERALAWILKEEYPNFRDLKIHESSPSKRGLSAMLKAQCPHYLETQFFPEEPRGGIVHGFRNENLEEQTFADESFDIVITQDVMEHVYNPAKAFSEICRTLKRGGGSYFHGSPDKPKPANGCLGKGGDRRETCVSAFPGISRESG